MERLACIDVEPLRLQLLRLGNPRWHGAPVAVLGKDGSEGTVLELDALARGGGVQVGMRYATALSLCPELRAAALPDATVDEVTARMVALLRRFSPDVEPFERGTLLVRATGLQLLTPSLAAWAERIRDTLQRRLGLASSVGVGFTRLGAIVAARQPSTRRRGGGVAVFEAPDEEQEALLAARLNTFAGLPPDALERLDRLALRTLGQLLALPGDAVRRRLGAEVHRLHRLATGAIDVPLAPVPEEERFFIRQDLEPAEKDAVRLLFRLKRLLTPLLRRARARGRVVRQLELTLETEDGDLSTERMGAAQPTLDEATWVELLRLRLERTPLRGGVGRLRLELRTIEGAAGQLSLLPSRARREVDKADEGLARVRAEFGDQAVVAARVRPEHVPERRYDWAPFGSLPPAAARPPSVRRADPLQVVRRIVDEPLSARHGAITSLGEPSFVSWGWWLDGDTGKGEGDAIDREYRYARMDSGALLWLTREAGRPHARWRVAAVVQ